MDRDELATLLKRFANGEIDLATALHNLQHPASEDLKFACLDHERPRRCGLPEVIFGQGKTPEQVEAIFAALTKRGQNVIATRVSPEAAERVCRQHPAANYASAARMLTLRQRPSRLTAGTVGVVCAGTSDLPVAEEARITLDMLDQRTMTCYDVGVAGLHRLLAHLDALRAARVLIVVAGMEGALPSVVGGLVASPIIAVPTSVGYGASFGGIAALLGMLNSCAPGVSVVNIDNGFGAACQAALINRLGERDEAHAEPDGPTPATREHE